MNALDAEVRVLIADVDAIADEAERTFGTLSPGQLDWKPRADRWSVAQCLDHLIRINSTYFPQLEVIERGGYQRTWRDRLPFLGRWFASLVLRAVAPTSERRFKTARHVEPSASAIGGDIVARFGVHQQELSAHMAKAGTRDSRTIVIRSPVAPVVFYSMLDAFRIIVTHERRHLLQAQRVMQSPEFPKA
jgi:hypothetical protein